MTDVTTFDRDASLLAGDDLLLAQCDEHRYRASGPGGQHRNKTQSAVRLHHRPSGITVTATERRSRHENLARALERLREAIAVQVRQPMVAGPFQPPAAIANITVGGRLIIGRRDPRRLVLLAWILDAMLALHGRASEAAGLFGLSTSQMVALLKAEPKRIAAANGIRAACGLDPLR